MILESGPRTRHIPVVSGLAITGYVTLHIYFERDIEKELKLAPESASVATARHALGDLADSVSSEKLADVQLAVSELVTNSILHANLAPTDLITLKVLAYNGAVSIEVTDCGPGFEAPTCEPDVNASEGRGLYLVDLIADRWSVQRKQGNTHVRLEIGPSLDYE